MYQYDFGRSKELGPPVFSKEVAMLIYAILAVSIVVSSIVLYQTNKMLHLEENRAGSNMDEAVKRLRCIRNMLAALVAVESIVVVLGVADYYM
jgi:hypothetical protein